MPTVRLVPWIAATGLLTLTPLTTPLLDGPGGLSAQELAQDADSIPGAITPGGAFLRSVLVPGWGHIATEAYGRGGFYIAAQTASLWMLRQTLDRKSEASAFVELEREVATARVIAGGVTDPDSVLIAVDADPAVRDREALVEARGQQVEDWSALSIFLVLLGGADAFVAAHLADYPEPLAFRVVPLGAGRTEVGLSIPSSVLGPLLPWRR